MQSLPKFLVISEGKYQWTSEYPNQTFRAMNLGEEIIFRPMRPYPQIKFCDGTVFRDDGVVLGQELWFEAHLPKRSAPTQLALAIKCPYWPTGTLSILEGNTSLADFSIKEQQELSTTVILPPGDERTVTLRFNFTPKLRNREPLRAPLRIILQRMKLN